MNQQRRKSVVSGYLFLLLISAVYSFTNTSLEIKGILSTSIIIIESLFFLLFLYFVGRYNIKKLLKIAFFTKHRWYSLFDGKRNCVFNN